MKKNKLGNSKISPLYQAIRHFSGEGIRSGAGGANYFEPFCIADYAVFHFTKLMKAYQAFEEEN